jgi:hypothetical protein
MKAMMKGLGVIMLAIFLLGAAMAPARADTSSATPYSGDIWHRSTLTGDWFGVRNDLALPSI